MNPLYRFAGIAGAAALLSVLVLLLGLRLHSNQDPAIGNASQSSGFAVYPAPIELPEFSLTDQHGQEFSRQRFRDRWTLVFFGFSSCEDICPLTLFELQKFQAGLNRPGFAEDTRIVMISVDPRRDTPQALNQYMARFNPEFTGLTGSLETITELASRLYITTMQPPDSHGHETQDHEQHETTSYQVGHSANIAVIGPDATYHSVIMAPHTAASLAAAYQQIRE